MKPRLYIAVLLTSLLAFTLMACGHADQDAPKLVTTVTPADPVPAYCGDRTKKRPRLVDKDYTDADTIRMSEALNAHIDYLEEKDTKCSTWAKGQR